MLAAILLLAGREFHLSPASAAGAVYYVSPSGSDANNGSQSRPFRQIRRALSAAQPGDTILVADGDYQGFDVQRQGMPGAPITIKALGNNANVLPTSDRSDNRDTIHIISSAHIVLDGLRSFNANRAAIRVNSSRNITIRNGVYGGNAYWGIFTNHSDDLLIENNRCYGSRNEHGIYVSNSGDRPTVRGNISYNNAKCGIQLNADVTAGGDGIISGALIENNVLYNNGATGGAAINMDGVHNSVIRNNLLYNNHASGIAAFRANGAAGPRGLQILHNTIDMASDGRWGLHISSTTGLNVVRNNILLNRHSFRGGLEYGNSNDVRNVDSDYNVVSWISADWGGSRLSLEQWQTRGYEPNSLSATPDSLFVNAGAGDYHLRSTAPAIDRGVTLADVFTDLDRKPRPSGNAYDIGCYEYASAPPPVQAPSFRLRDGSVAPSESVTLDLEFTANNAAVTSAGFDLLFDANKLTLSSASALNLPAGVSVVTRERSAGRIGVAIYGTQNSAWTSGKIANFTFKAAAGVSGGSTPIRLVLPNATTSGVQVSNAQGVVTNAAATDGTVTFLAGYRVSGTVLSNGSGLSGVTVTAGTTSTTTASDGTYVLNGLSAGTYTVRASKSGYVFTPESQSVTVGPDKTGVNFTGSPTGGTPGGFLKGINLAGNAVTIEGNRWLSYAEAQASGLSATSASTWAGNYSFPLSPAADADTKRMLESTVWRAGAGNGQGFRLRQTVPNGSYQVYLWCIENYTSHFRNMDVKLEGVTVASRIGDLPLGTWRKYGPYPATVTDGALDLEILRGTKGDPVLMGLALFSAGGGTGPTPPTEPATYSIRGKVSAGTSGLSGVTVTAGSTSTTTAADGTYTLSGLTAGSYTVTAAKTGYDVTPASRSVTVGPNQTGVDFSATPQAPSTYSIRGIVRVNGTGLPGVTVRTEGASATTASDGSYTLSGLPAGTYSVSASRAEYTFNGPRSVTLGPDQSGIDFTGTRLTYAVRGRVTVNGTGLSGVTVAAGSTSTTTAADGSYTLSGLPAGTYSITPARSGYGFTPANRSVTVGPDQTGIDFSATSTGGTPGGFLKGINLAGDAVTIEGNRWLSYSQALASGLSATSASTYRGLYSFPLSPAADADTKRMLESTVWRAGAGNGQGFRLRQTVPNGSYQVYLWCIENYTSHFRNMDVKLEGVTVASRIGDLPLGTWRKYGPYPATVTDGALDLEILRGTKGDPILMGLAIFSSGSGTSAMTSANNENVSAEKNQLVSIRPGSRSGRRTEK